MDDSTNTTAEQTAADAPAGAGDNAGGQTANTQPAPPPADAGSTETAAAGKAKKDAKSQSATARARKKADASKQAGKVVPETRTDETVERVERGDGATAQATPPQNLTGGTLVDYSDVEGDPGQWAEVDDNGTVVRGHEAIAYRAIRDGGATLETLKAWTDDWATKAKIDKLGEKAGREIVVDDDSKRISLGARKAA